MTFLTGDEDAEGDGSPVADALEAEAEEAAAASVDEG
jgi:hypothetical protein